METENLSLILLLLLKRKIWRERKLWASWLGFLLEDFLLNLVSFPPVSKVIVRAIRYVSLIQNFSKHSQYQRQDWEDFIKHREVERVHPKRRSLQKLSSQQTRRQSSSRNNFKVNQKCCRDWESRIGIRDWQSDRLSWDLAVMMGIGRSGKKDGRWETHLQRLLLLKAKKDRKVSIEKSRFNWEKVDSDGIGDGDGSKDGHVLTSNVRRSASSISLHSRRNLSSRFLSSNLTIQFSNLQSWSSDSHKLQNHQPSILEYWLPSPSLPLPLLHLQSCRINQFPASERRRLPPPLLMQRKVRVSSESMVNPSTWPNQRSFVGRFTNQSWSSERISSRE